MASQPRDTTQQSDGVRMPRLGKISATGPLSTTRPAYMTTTRSQCPATIPRLWVIRIVAKVLLAGELAHQFEVWA